MRRLATAATAVAATLILLGLSRHLLQAISTEDTSYTASADHTIAVPAIEQGDGWQTTLYIQNTGSVPTSARVEFFGGVNVECPAVRQPLAVHCVGPILPGAAETFDVGRDPTLADARSAMVYSTRPGDAGCDTVAGEPLAVLVRRARTDNVAARIAGSIYVGVAPAVAGFWDEDQQAYVTVVPWVEVTSTHRTILHFQNIGQACADGVEFEVLSGPGCLPLQETLPGIPPGQSLRIEVAGEFQSALSGSAWVRSPQPLAVVVDRWPDDETMLSTHVTGRAATHQAVDAPLILQDGTGWHTVVRNQNASARFTAFVRTAYRTTELTPTLESRRVVCPGGSTPIDTPAVPELPLPFTGTVALTSLALGPDQPEVPPLAADVDLLAAAGGAAYHAPNRITGTLAAPDIALPWLTKGYHALTTSPGLTYTSRIAVVNQSQAGEGFVSLSFYDLNGSPTTFQLETPLGPRAMRMIDLADIDELPAGWCGSAILQFLSLDPGASVGATVLETASGALGDGMTSYAGIVTHVQAPPTPPPSPTVAASATPQASATPGPTETPVPSPTLLSRIYLPLL